MFVRNCIQGTSLIFGSIQQHLYYHPGPVTLGRNCTTISKKIMLLTIVVPAWSCYGLDEVLVIVLRVANFKHVQNNRDAFVAKSGRSSVLVVDFFSLDYPDAYLNIASGMINRTVKYL